MSPVKISIIIRCFNEEKYIEKLLKNIFKQTEKSIEVILVDSGSTDETINIASNYPVKILNIPSHEFSFGRALNFGCQAANGEYLVFASAHVYPQEKDWLEKLIEPLTDPEIALVYGKQRGNEKSKYSELRIFKKWFPENSIIKQDIPFCNNANAAIKKEIWEKYPYNEKLTGLEDLEWAKIVISNGYYLSYSAEAGIIHIHEETPKRIYNRYFREAIAMHQTYSDQKFSIFDFIWLLLINTGMDYINAIHDRKLFRNIFNIPVFRLMQFWGTYKGYHYNRSVNERLRRRFYYPSRNI